MNRKLTKMNRQWMIAICVMTLCLGNLAAGVATRAQEEETLRKLWDDGFLKKRPSKTSRPARPQKPSSGPATSTQAPDVNSGSGPLDQATYQRITPALTDASGEALVGITIWRLRASQTTDDQERILVHKAKKANWIPERIHADTPLAEGQRVRLSIEAPRTGFLYVIDRERYKDGTLGEPYLIFPTLHIRRGDHALTAGRVIEIPAQDDDPPYFRLEVDPPNPKYAGEVLTVLVTPEPLPGLKIGKEMLKLSREQVSAWEKKWSAPWERFELKGGAGKSYTAAEKAAGAKPAQQLLAQDEAPPQTIYRVAAKPGAPLLIEVPLQIGK